VLTQVDAFFKAQLENGADSGLEAEDDGALAFPEDALVCD
jgi:hypothetical protein